MGHNKTFSERIHDFLASVRLTLFIFGALAATSILGTLIPQGATTEQRLSQYGPKLNALIELLDLADMYHSWWFQVLLILLSINLIICSLRRLPKTLKSLEAARRLIGPTRVQKMQTNTDIRLACTPAETQRVIAPLLSKRFSYSSWREENGAWQAVAEKGRIGRLGAYFIHLSVLLILVGALLGSIFGFKGFVNINEKEAKSTVQLRGEKGTVPLGFEIRCDKFTVDFYDTGAPKEFRSDVSILEQGKIVQQAAIRVNDPFSYKGMTFYQSTYGSQPTGIVLNLTDLKTSESKRLQVPFRQAVNIPGTKNRLVVMDFAQNIGTFGPAFFVAMAQENKEPAGTWVVVKEPDFHGNKIGNTGIGVIEYVNRFYTGLQVTKDPGVWVIYIGFILMLLSMIIAMYISHRRIWLVFSSESKGTRVLMAGNANKHILAFEREFNQLTQEISDLDLSENEHD
ncbi:MAG: cytochrome c biogenesis protein ResB [Deltaproteobacteria bacterium]|nr:MAG: cytochrome c biogenesis protein ResB [Deltaproteobacteria bacterium]